MCACFSPTVDGLHRRRLAGVGLPRWQAIPWLSLAVDGSHVVHSFQRREGENRRSGAPEGVKRGELVHSFPTPRPAGTSPRPPQHARRRPLSRAPQSVERRFHLEKMVEETDPGSKRSPRQTRSASSITGTSGQACAPRIEPSPRQVESGATRCELPPLRFAAPNTVRPGSRRSRSGGRY